MSNMEYWVKVESVTNKLIRSYSFVHFLCLVLFEFAQELHEEKIYCFGDNFVIYSVLGEVVLFIEE